MSYLIQLGPVVYEPKGEPGGTFTFVDAMRQVYGVGDARIIRVDGTVAVDDAGSSTEVVYVMPDGRRRRVRRRRTWRAREAWEAGVTARAVVAG